LPTQITVTIGQLLDIFSLITFICNYLIGGVTVAGNFLMKTSYNCPFCGMPFEKIIPLSEHIKKDHPDDLERKYYPCFHCKQIFLTQERRDNDWKDVCQSRKKKADAVFKMNKKGTIKIAN
jgi:DNA-directed RNA polymerase subunit RPC12/RpoP